MHCIVLYFAVLYGIATRALRLPLAFAFQSIAPLGSGSQVEMGFPTWISNMESMQLVMVNGIWFFSAVWLHPTHINGASAVIWLQSWGCAMLPTGWGEHQFLSYVLLWILFSKVVVIRLKLTSHFWVPQTKANKCLHHAVSSAGCTSACWMAMCIPSSAGQKVFHHVSDESCNLRPIYSCHSCHFVVIVSYRRWI